MFFWVVSVTPYSVEVLLISRSLLEECYLEEHGVTTEPGFIVLRVQLPEDFFRGIPSR